MLRNLIIIAGLTIISNTGILAQPEIKAVFTDTPPVIDGFVNDAVWSNAVMINELFQREPNTGEPVSEKTEFLFLFDHNNIYVGIRCYDDPKGITAKELARDVSLGEDDRVQIILDTYLDGTQWILVSDRSEGKYR